MTRWSVYAGTFTKEFAEEIERLRSSGTDWWRGNAKKTADVPPVDTGAAYWPAGGRLANGIERFTFDDQTGDLRQLETVTGDLRNPQYLAAHPTLPVLYAAEYARPGRLITFGVGEDGALARRATTDSGGLLAVAVSVHPSGRVAYVAHWGDGTLSACQLDRDGSPVEVDAIVRAPQREPDRAHHHDVRITPGGNGVLVTDVGADDLTVYAADESGALRTPAAGRIAFPAGSGPRHIEFHPSGRYVYVVGEWDSALYVLEAEDWLPRKIVNRYPTVPPGYQGKNKTSELCLHPDGRTLFVGNRDSDSIAVFSVDDSGHAETLGHYPSCGRGPASVKVDPAGRHLLVGNVYSGSLAVFGIGPDRQLHLAGAPVTARAPRYLLFRRDPGEG
jgi:6-phosphogluconolactonase